MGKRSRKQRPETGGSASTRAERDARRQAAAKTTTRRGTREAPPAPWGSFPLTELVVLIALVFGVVGFIRFETHSGKVMVAAAMVLGSLGGLEVSIREHFAGFRSHTLVLSAFPAVATAVVIAFARVPLVLVVPIMLGVFLLAFVALRRVWERKRVPA